MANIVFGAAPGFSCFTVLAVYADFYLSSLRREGAAVHVVGGGDPAVDELAERYARSRRLPWRRAADAWAPLSGLPADATHLIVFWDGRSAEPPRLVAEARRRGLLYRVARL